MCTLTWLTKPDGYQIFFNRDELITRQQAQSPLIHTYNGVKVICPIDPDHGGTWITVNQYALSLALLNKYEDEKSVQPDLWKSRGILVSELSSLPNQVAVVEALNAADLFAIKAFDLIIFEPRKLPVQMTWNGTELIRTVGPKMPLTSSSFDTLNVISSRKKYFEESMSAGDISEQLLISFHNSHSPKRGPYSVCMHRDDGYTVSFSRIDADSNKVSFAYKNGPLCETRGMQQLSMQATKHSNEI
jgi:hypothetical protein